MLNILQKLRFMTTATLVVVAGLFACFAMSGLPINAAPVVGTPIVGAPAGTSSSATTPEAAAIASANHIVIDTDTRDVITSVSGSVIFVVNRTEVKPNTAFIKKLHGEILERITEQHLELFRIDVRGAASPEGPIANNERLAKGRTKVLIDSITSILPTAQGDIFNVTSVTEDYEYLIQMMEDTNDPDAQLVKDIYSKWKHSIVDLKWALMTAKKRTLWKRLLSEYFPALRATRVKLYFREHIPSEPALCECCGMPDCTCAGKTFADGTPMGCQCNHDSGCHCLEGQPCPCKENGGTCHCSKDEGCPCQPVVEPADTTAIADTLTTDTIPAEIIETPVTPQPEIEINLHRRPILAFSTNLIYDLWYQPDYGFAPMWNGRLEYLPLRGHFTYAASFTNPYWHKWNKHKFFQIRNYELEARWYHRFDREKVQRWGWFLGAAIDANKFGIGLGDRRGWQGEGVGAQLVGGYVLPLDKHKDWKLHFTAGFGYYMTKYDPYLWGTPDFFGHEEDGKYYYNTNLYRDEFVKRQHRFTWFGPTQIGVSISYDFLFRKGTGHKDEPKSRRRGVSFRHWEKRHEKVTD